MPIPGGGSTQAAEFNLAYAIDAGPQLSPRGRVVMSTLVAVELVDSRLLFESFRHGHQLHVNAAGETFVFDLNNSSKALAAALECTRRYVAGSRMVLGPFSPAQPALPQPQLPQGHEHRAEATTIVAHVLSSAGIAGFRVLPREQMLAALQQHDAIWLADGGLSGLLNIESSPSFSNAEQVATSLMAGDARTCRGAFASGRYPTEPETGSARLVTACSNTEKPSHVNYTIAPRLRGGFYVFAIVGSPEGVPAVQGADARLHQAALRTLNPR